MPNNAIEVCDLDAGDVDNPLMVSEYVVEIFEYLRTIEVCTYIYIYIIL